MIQRLRKKRQQDEAGFTLVELLVVIVILGILAAIVVFAVGGVTDKGTVNAKLTDVSSLQAAEEAEFASTKTIPPVYVGMTELQTLGFLRSASTYNAICLFATDGANPSRLAGSDYYVVSAGAACTNPSPKTGTYTLAP